MAAVSISVTFFFIRLLAKTSGLKKKKKACKVKTLFNVFYYLYLIHFNLNSEKSLIRTMEPYPVYCGGQETVSSPHASKFPSSRDDYSKCRGRHSHGKHQRKMPTGPQVPY